ncbi:MAG: hypothetical protein ACTH5D_03015 [Halomonas sp.]|uniref:hypothetical protein n=1 Tax=Halomonas sp. TaxID=1486246 RepID=UPI003F93D897
MAVKYLGATRRVIALGSLLLAAGASAEQSIGDEHPIRVEHLQRCGDLLQQDIQEFCLNVSGLDSSDFQVKLNGMPPRPTDMAQRLPASLPPPGMKAAIAAFYAG